MNLFAEAGRLTNEARNIIEAVKVFLGEDALKYIIIVFSKCNKEYTKFPKKFQKSWNNEIHNLTNSLGNRWTVSPNPDVFSPDDEVFVQRLEDLRDHILSTYEVYQIKYFEDYRKNLEEMLRAKREEEKNRQMKIEENEVLKIRLEVEEKANKELRDQLENAQIFYTTNKGELEKTKKDVEEKLEKLNKSRCSIS